MVHRLYVDVVLDVLRACTVAFAVTPDCRVGVTGQHGAELAALRVGGSQGTGQEPRFVLFEVQTGEVRDFLACWLLLLDANEFDVWVCVGGVSRLLAEVGTHRDDHVIIVGDKLIDVLPVVVRASGLDDLGGAANRLCSGLHTHPGRVVEAFVTQLRNVGDHTDLKLFAARSTHGSSGRRSACRGRCRRHLRLDLHLGRGRGGLNGAVGISLILPCLRSYPGGGSRARDAACCKQRHKQNREQEQGEFVARQSGPPSARDLHKLDGLQPIHQYSIAALAGGIPGKVARSLQRSILSSLLIALRSTLRWTISPSSSRVPGVGTKARPLRTTANNRASFGSERSRTYLPAMKDETRASISSTSPLPSSVRP